MTGIPALDALDERLIELLAADSRQSNRSIARDLGISEMTLRKRIRRLEDSGAISYGLVVDVRATGMSVSGYTDVQVAAPHLQTVAEAISAMDLCVMCCISTGRSNIRCYLYAPDSRAMGQLIEEISLMPGVLSVEFREATSQGQHRYELLMLEGLTRKRWQG